MAKSKKSRRARRVEIQKPPAQPAVAPQPAPETTPVAPANNRKLINFSQEYFYVYHDMRNVVIIGLLMFAIMTALSFVI
jgi:hypothetical protein